MVLIDRRDPPQHWPPYCMYDVVLAAVLYVVHTHPRRETEILGPDRPSRSA